MDDVWLQILDRSSIQDVLRLRRVSRYFECLCRKSMRSRREIDIELDCPLAISNPSSIAYVIEQCGSNLHKLIMRVRAPNEKYSVMPSTSHIDSTVIKSICQNAKRLKHLRIDRMIVTVGAAEQFGELPAGLETIQLSNSLIDCSEWDVVTVLKYSFEKLLQKCKQLKTFEISGKNLQCSHFHLDPSVLQNLSDTVENLSIAVGSSLKIEHLSFLKNKKLKSLVLERSFISASSLEYIVNMSDSLTFLDLSRSPNLLDTQDISKLSLLKYLNLSNNRDGVNDDALRSIILGCPMLEQLSIDQCSFLTLNSLVYIGDLKRLQKLTMSGVSNVNDTVCMHISRCLNLSFLDLNFCKKVHKRGLQCILSSLLNLEHLEVLGISAYSHHLLAKQSNFPRTIVCDSPIQTFSFELPPIPNLVAA